MAKLTDDQKQELYDSYESIKEDADRAWKEIESGDGDMVRAAVMLKSVIWMANELLKNISEKQTSEKKAESDPVGPRCGFRNFGEGE